MKIRKFMILLAAAVVVNPVASAMAARIELVGQGSIFLNNVSAIVDRGSRP